MTAAPMPDFESPPVLEVVAGVQFETLSGMQTRHFGQFWQLVNREFPNSQDAPPLPDVSESFTVQVLTLPPLRRMILVSGDNQYVIQIQDSRFHINWRKTRNTDSYPRFPTIHRQFQTLWDQFATFISQTNLGPLKPARYELTYVNHIDVPDTDVVASIESRVKMYSWNRIEPTFLPRPSSVSMAWQFGMPDGKGQLSANLSHAERAKRQIVVLNMACAGPAASHYSLDEWFEAAHEWIVRGFADLTTESAQKEWGRRT